MGSLVRLLHDCRLALAHYDPLVPSHPRDGPLKIEDHLAAGRRVVSPLPTRVDDGVVGAARYGVPAVAEATRVALSQPARLEPSKHQVPVGAGHSLQAVVATVEATL